MSSDEESQLKDEKKPLIHYRKVENIEVVKIRPNSMNPRDSVARKEVEDLMESIRAVGGVLVPVVVYSEDSHYVLLDGERRWRAASALAKEDPKFAKIPANIIAKPAGDFENLKTMFNIHYKRRGWTTSALAVALGRLERLGKTGVMPTNVVSRLTGLTPVAVDEARLFLRMPTEIRARCLRGDLKEYYVILLARNLRAIERSYPDLMKHHEWDDLARSFVKKVDLGYVKRSSSFNLLSKMARFSIEHDAEGLFERTFDRLTTQTDYTLDEAYGDVRSELGVRLEEDLQDRCKQFLVFFDSYVREKRSPFGTPTIELLQKILDRIKSEL